MMQSRAVRLGATILLAAAGLVGFGVTPALAVDSVTSYTVDGSLGVDGQLDLRASLALDGTPAQVQQRFATTLNHGRDEQYRFTISGVKASVNGTAVTPTVTTDGDYQVITVATGGQAGPVEIDYSVTGAAIDLGDGATEVNWRLLQGLNLPVKTFDATIKVPGVASALNCYAGAPTAPGNCGYFAGGTHDQPDPVFHSEGLGSGQVVGAVMRFKSSVVKPNSDLRRLWTLDNAFSASPLPLGLAALVALGGGLAYWLLHRRVGRDAGGAAAPTVLGSFKPVGPGQSEFSVESELRPGEIGTLADERVDPIDVTASVLDLAVRNHLLIEQLPRASEFKATDWALSRRESSAALRPYEKTLLDAVAPAAGGPRLLGEVAPALIAALPAIQSQLYDEVVRQGWFSTRPDAVRGRWTRLGWVAIAAAAVVAVLLIAFTQFGLLALMLVALASGVGLLGQVMPARTAKGSAALAGLGVLRGTLLTQSTDEMPKGREHEELASVLPYAVVLGGADRWLDGIAAINDEAADDATELSWYHGPEGWKLTDLPDSLRSFVRAFQGTLVART